MSAVWASPRLGVSVRGAVAGRRPMRCGHQASRRMTLQRSGIRLTRRGRGLVLAVLMVVIAALVIGGALRATAASTDVPTGWSTTVVQPGDTLWSLAQSRSGGGDPRSLIVAIKSINGLSSAGVVSGQRLLLPN